MTNEEEVTDTEAFRRFWVDWWPNAEESTKTDFARLLARWQKMGDQDHPREAPLERWAVQDGMKEGFGVLVLPFMVKAIEEGQTDLIPFMSELTGSEVPWDATPAQCRAWLDANPTRWQYPKPETK